MKEYFPHGRVLARDYRPRDLEVTVMSDLGEPGYLTHGLAPRIFVGTRRGQVWMLLPWPQASVLFTDVSKSVTHIGRATGWAFAVCSDHEIFLVRNDSGEVVRSVTLESTVTCPVVPLAVAPRTHALFSDEESVQADECLVGDANGVVRVLDSKLNEVRRVELPDPIVSLGLHALGIVVAAGNRVELRDREDLQLRASVELTGEITALGLNAEVETLVAVGQSNGRILELKLPKPSPRAKGPGKIGIHRDLEVFPGAVHGLNAGSDWIVAFSRAGEFGRVRRSDRRVTVDLDCGAPIVTSAGWWFTPAGGTPQYVHYEDSSLTVREHPSWARIRTPIASHHLSGQVAGASDLATLILCDVDNSLEFFNAGGTRRIEDLMPDPTTSDFLLLCSEHRHAPHVVTEKDLILDQDLASAQEIADYLGGEDELTRLQYEERGARLIFVRVGSGSGDELEPHLDLQVEPGALAYRFLPGGDGVLAIYPQAVREYDTSGALTREWSFEAEAKQAHVLDDSVVLIAPGPGETHRLISVDLEAGKLTETPVPDHRRRYCVCHGVSRGLVFLTDGLCYDLEKRAFIDGPEIGPDAPVMAVAENPVTGDTWVLRKDSVCVLNASWKLERCAPIFGAEPGDHLGLSFTATGDAILALDFAVQVGRDELPEPFWLVREFFSRESNDFPLDRAPLDEAHRRVAEALEAGERVRLAGAAKFDLLVAAFERQLWDDWLPRPERDSRVPRLLPQSSRLVVDEKTRDRLEAIAGLIRHAPTLLTSLLVRAHEGTPLMQRPLLARKSIRPIRTLKNDGTTPAKPEPAAKPQPAAKKKARKKATAEDRKRQLDAVKKLVARNWRFPDLTSYVPDFVSVHWGKVRGLVHFSGKGEESLEQIVQSASKRLSCHSLDGESLEPIAGSRLTHLWLTGSADLAPLRDQKSIVSLSLSGSMQNLDVIHSLPGLRILTLGHLQPALDLSELPSGLEALQLPQDLDLKTWLRLIPSVPNLRYVLLSRVPTRGILACEALPELRALDLRAHEGGRDVELPDLPNLLGLGLKLGAKTGKLMESAHRAPKLEHLDLAGSNGKNFKVIGQWPALRRLNTEDIPYKRLASDVEQLEHLEVLAVEAKTATPFGAMQKLQEIHLCADSASHLDALLDCPALQKIAFWTSGKLDQTPSAGVRFKWR